MSQHSPSWLIQPALFGDRSQQTNPALIFFPSHPRCKFANKTQNVVMATYSFDSDREAIVVRMMMRPILKKGLGISPLSKLRKRLASELRKFP